jgi:WD40 repeat protein
LLFALLLLLLLLLLFLTMCLCVCLSLIDYCLGKPNNDFKSRDVTFICLTLISRALFVCNCGHEPVVAASTLDGRIKLYNAQDSKLLKDIDAGPVETWDIDFHPDGGLIASSCQTGTAAINLFDIDSGEKKSSLGVKSGTNVCVAFSPDARLIACGAMDGSVSIFNVLEQKKRNYPNVNYTLSVCRNIDRFFCVCAQFTHSKLTQWL